MTLFDFETSAHNNFKLQPNGERESEREKRNKMAFLFMSIFSLHLLRWDED